MRGRSRRPSFHRGNLLAPSPTLGRWHSPPRRRNSTAKQDDRSSRSHAAVAQVRMLNVFISVGSDPLAHRLVDRRESVDATKAPENGSFLCTSRTATCFLFAIPARSWWLWRGVLCRSPSFHSGSLPCQSLRPEFRPNSLQHRKPSTREPRRRVRALRGRSRRPSGHALCKSNFPTRLHGEAGKLELLVFPVFSRVFSIQLHISQASPYACRRPPPVANVGIGGEVEIGQRETACSSEVGNIIIYVYLLFPVFSRVFAQNPTSQAPCEVGVTLVKVD